MLRLFFSKGIVLCDNKNSKNMSTDSKTETVDSRPDSKTETVDLRPDSKTESVKIILADKKFEEDFGRSYEILPYAEGTWYKKIGYDLSTLAGTHSIVTEKTGNALFDAFYHAYNCHGRLRLRPEDFFVVFLASVTSYINLNPEDFRKKMIGNSTKKGILINIPAFPDFEPVIEQYIQECDPNFLTLMEPDFSTTSPLDRLVSKCFVMDAIKKIIPLTLMTRCGINSFEFLGTTADWENLVTKTEKLANLIGSQFRNYYEYELAPIFKTFVEIHKTYNEKSQTERPELSKKHRDFLENAFVRHRSGSGRALDFTGWLAKLFPLAGKMSVPETYNDISRSRTNVPVKWVRFGEKIDLTFEAGILATVVNGDTFSCIHGARVYE